jgi:hypothetical protein
MRRWRTRKLGWMTVVGLLVVTAVSATPASAAKPTPGAKYRVDTGGSEISIWVARNGKSLELNASAFTRRCSNGQEDALAMVNGRKAKVSATGAFSGHFVVPNYLLDTFVAREEMWVSGKFIRKGKAAKITLRGQLVGEGGTVCDSGERSVIAKRVRRR